MEVVVEVLFFSGVFSSLFILHQFILGWKPAQQAFEDMEEEEEFVIGSSPVFCR